MTEDPKYLSRYDPNWDVSANWKKADVLRDGWFHYCAHELRERYRDSGRNLHLSKSLEFEMKHEVRRRIEDEEILAFGIRSSSDPSIEVERISPILFQTNETQIDWEGGRIVSLGQEFRDVRICVGPDQTGNVVSLVVPAAKKPNRRGGRPSQYPQAREILRELYAEHAGYKRFSADRLIVIFNERYLAKFAPPGQRLAPVSPRALRNYIEEYRQELAQTGNN